MEIAFATKELRNICEMSECTEQFLGPEIAKTLRHRLADIRAAISINDLIAGSPQRKAYSEEEALFINLTNDNYLVLSPNHRRNPKNELGVVDWSRVNRVKIIYIGNYHVN